MRSPARAIAGHLMWTRTGSVWAIWRLNPLAYGYRPTKDKHEARSLHQALIRSLPGESLLLGVCAGLDPAAVVERMIEGVDLAACPDWAAECEATLDTLDAIGIGQRVYWLAVPLGDTSGKEKALEPFRAATADVRDMLGLPRPGVSDKEISRRLAQAKRVAEGIPAPFRPTPASAAQMVWLHLHAQQRGLFADVSLPDEPGDLNAELLTPRSGTALSEPLLDEGGQSDLDRRQLSAWNPLERRYLKVAQPHAVTGTPASYQSMLVLADVPDEGMVFPGSEFLGRIDECGLEVDWAMRLTVRASDQVAKQNRRALINLNEQFDQRSGELSHGLNTLERAAADLAEYAQLLDSDKLEVEAQATIVFAVASDDPTDVADQARKLADYFGSAGYRLQQPLGYQEDLWWAMIPGSPTTKTVTEFAQITTSKALSATVPFASTDLGDTSGSLLGINISTGRPGAVLHDIAGASFRDVSGSMGIAGALGSGKSVLMKMLCGDVVDRGGQIVVPDRTTMGEWAHWASSVTKAVIVDIANPTVSLDPLRMYGPQIGSRITQSFLTTLLNVAPTSQLGVALSEVLEPAYLAKHQLTGLGDLLNHLNSGQAELDDAPAAKSLARMMNVFARKDLGRVVFDNMLKPLRPSAPAIIIRTHTLELPNAEELLTPQLFEQMSVEKIFGRATYTLLAGLARQICFSDRSRLGVFAVDECHHLTNSPEGEAAIKDFVRDGRKHQGAVILGSHDPEADFGSETLRGLIPTRIQMRQTDKNLARKGLRWLDMDPNDEDLLDMLINDTSPSGPHGVPEHRRGEAFMRDSSGNVGRIKVLAPALPARNQAVRTSPPESTHKTL